MSRVLILNLAQGTGHGAEKVLVYLLEGGKGTLEKEVIVAAPPESYVLEMATALGYSTMPWPAKRSGLRYNTTACLRFMKALPVRPSLVHAWHPEAFEAAQLLGTINRCPVAGTLHDAVERFGRRRERYFFWHTALRSMKGLVLVSEKTAEGWRARTNVPIHVIRNGLPRRAETARRSTDGVIQVGFLGSYAQWKGMETLPDLMKKTRDLPLHWNLYGDLTASLKPVLLQISSSFGDRVTFHGYQETEKIYENLDLVIHPSIRHDPYPTVLLEAARAGLPVLASKVGGVAEIVDDDETGMLYPTGDKAEALRDLRLLATDADLRAKLGKNGRQRFEEKFQVGLMVANYRQFWTDLGGIMSDSLAA